MKLTIALVLSLLIVLDDEIWVNDHHLAWGQALWAALALGREKEGKLAATFLEFDFLH